MEGYKINRHQKNPLEKKLHDKFIKDHCDDDMDLIVFPPSLKSDGFESDDKLTDREKKIVISTIQWLGSPVGQTFLQDSGFKQME